MKTVQFKTVQFIVKQKPEMTFVEWSQDEGNGDWWCEDEMQSDYQLEKSETGKKSPISSMRHTRKKINDQKLKYKNDFSKYDIKEPYDILDEEIVNECLVEYNKHSDVIAKLSENFNIPIFWYEEVYF